MNVASLKVRFLIAWAVFIVVILQMAGLGLHALFERSITRRTIEELNFDLDQLTKSLKVEIGGTVALSPRGPTDPQFDVPNGGRYWQVYAEDRPILSSPSLSAQTLTNVRLERIGETTSILNLMAPNKKPLLAVARRFQLNDEGSKAGKRLVLVSAVNASEIKEDTEKFAADLLTGLVGMAIVLLMGAWAHVTIGLQPLNTLREAVAKVRLGQSHQVDGTFPIEIRPLVEETNALLRAQDTAMEAARARAGDLAHGLKTPLAIMAAKSRLLRMSGGADLADEIDRQVEAMRRHVQRELARARAKRGLTVVRNPIDIGAASRDLVSAIQSLPRARLLDWDLAITSGILITVDRADFNDMLGNLLDNAQRWAAGRVRVAVQRSTEAIEITIEDDGPGVAEHDLAQILKRGQKADTSRDGSGLGLAIVGDLVELYSGTLQLSRASLGGLQARLTLPVDARSKPSFAL